MSRVYSGAQANPNPEPSELIPAESVRDELDRIVRSPIFRASLRLTKFLSFVVEAKLSGKAGQIKAYTIAVEALGRSSDFDPQTDPIVRVQAARLREALARYYADAGGDDAIVIDLPRGTYVPTFHSAMHRHASELDAAIETARDALQASRGLLGGRYDWEQSEPAVAPLDIASAFWPATEAVPTARAGQREPNAMHEPTPSMAPAVEAPAVELSPHRTWGDRIGAVMRRPGPAGAAAHAGAHRPIVKWSKYLLGAICALAVLDTLFDIDRPLHGGPNTGLVFRLWAKPTAVALSPIAPDVPVIYVEPPVTFGELSPHTISAKMLHDRTVDALARFDDVTIVKGAPPDQTAAISATGAPSPSAYRLTTTAQYGPGETLTITAQLLDAAEASIVWSKTYQRSSIADGDWENDILAGDMAALLLQPFGVIEARERSQRATASRFNDAYLCLLDAKTYLRSFNRALYPAVEECLTRAGAEPSPSASIFVSLARIHLLNYQFGIGGAPGDRTSLARAHRMAERAIEIKPNSALAQYALQDVLLAEGDIPRAREAGDASLRLNPYDGAVVFGHASLLIRLGDVDQGLALLRQNAARTATTWIGYHLMLGLGSYLSGDYKTAAVETAQLANPFFPAGLVLDALVSAKTGDRMRAQQDISALFLVYPSWRDNFRANAALLLPDEAMLDRVTADFTVAAADLSQ